MTWLRLSKLLPKKLVYFCVVRAATNAAQNPEQDNWSQITIDHALKSLGVE